MRAHVVTIGVFDGVHRGHLAVLAQARAEADRRGIDLAVVTFDPHPMAVVRPEIAPDLVTTLSERVQLLTQAGVDNVFVLPFTVERAAQAPADFITDVLVRELHAAALVVGEDFRFGRRAAGDVALLRELGPSLGFEVVVLDDLGANGHRWSSSHLRQLIAEGDLPTAADILGRPIIVTGIVAKGEQRGRTIGYPTANIALPDGLVRPPDGVYAGRLRRLDGSHGAGFPAWPAAISIGTNPTFGEHSHRLEAFVLDADQHPTSDLELYGVEVEIELVQWLRPMLAFDGLDELLKAMADDVARTREVVS